MIKINKRRREITHLHVQTAATEESVRDRHDRQQTFKVGSRFIEIPEFGVIFASHSVVFSFRLSRESVSQPGNTCPLIIFVSCSFHQLQLREHLVGGSEQRKQWMLLIAKIFSTGFGDEIDGIR